MSRANAFCWGACLGVCVATAIFATSYLREEARADRLAKENAALVRTMTLLRREARATSFGETGRWCTLFLPDGYAIHVEKKP